MLDVSFSELLLIGVVALVVIGPERLPKVARTAGLLLGRAQRYVHDVKTEIEREAQLEEIQKMKDAARESAMRLEASLQTRAFDIERQAKEVAAEVSDLRPINRPAPPPPDVLAAEAEIAAANAAAVEPAAAEAAEPAAASPAQAEPSESVQPPVDDKQLCIDFGEPPKKS